MRLFAVVAAVMAADLVTFATIVPGVGIGAESNPAMARLYLTVGLSGVVLLKAVCTAAILLLVARCGVPSRRVGAAAVGITIALIGVAGNLDAIIR